MLNHREFKAAEFLVVGDLMLDKYVRGSIHRISPEAPVPILLHASEHYVLGGAGNVANNLRTLGGKVHLLGVLGDDDAGNKFIDLANKAEISLIKVFDKTKSTTCKTRFLGNNQQILRLDHENTNSVAPEIESKLFERVAKIIDLVSVIIISDYAKGLLTPLILSQIINLAKSKKIPILADPKGNDYSRYSGVDYIKPNRGELELLTKMRCKTKEEVFLAARYLSEAIGSNVIVTLSNEGMVLSKKDGSFYSYSSQAKNVFDVSGAGDTAIASFAFSLAQGEMPEQALKFANIAAGITVSKVGTAVVSLDEIDSAINLSKKEVGSRPSGITDIAEAVKVRKLWAAEGLLVGFTNGCFDLMHPGHISLLKEASSKCDRLIVAINSDHSVKRLKGAGRPIQAELSRAIVLDSIRDVDLVLIFDEDTPLEIIKALNPDVLIKGSDYEEKDIVGADFVKNQGGSVVRVNILDGHSTSKTIQKFNTGKL